MILADVRAAIVATVKSQIAGLRTVETHRGRFDSVAEIKRYATRAPAILIACMGFDTPAQSAGLVNLPVQWAAFVVTRDTPQQTRDAWSLALAAPLAQLINSQTWGRDDVSAAGAVRARNLYAAALDQLGAAIWALTWTQTVTIEATDLATLADFLTYHQDTDMYPPDQQIDISQTTDMPQ